MAILQCNKCTNLFHDDAPHECDVERWQRLAREAQQAYGRAIRAINGAPKPVIEPIPPGPYVEPRLDPKPATPQPPEWLCSRRGESAILWHWWIERGHKGGPTCETCGTTIQAFRDEDRLCATPLDRALDDFTARRKAKREQAATEEFFEGSQWGEHLQSYPAQNEAIARAMSTPLPHDPDIHTRVMPWRGKE